MSAVNDVRVTNLEKRMDDLLVEIETVKNNNIVKATTKRCYALQ